LRSKEGNTSTSAAATDLNDRDQQVHVRCAVLSLKGSIYRHKDKEKYKGTVYYITLLRKIHSSLRPRITLAWNFVVQHKLHRTCLERQRVCGRRAAAG
jgi:hypothetical protein